MAHVLVAYKQFPAPSVGHAGGESLFWMMAGLHRRGHTLTLVARPTDEELALTREVASICRRVYTVRHHRSRSGPRAVAVARSYLALRRAIRAAVARDRPDFVHVETTQTALAAAGLPLPSSSYRTQDVNWFLVDQQFPRLRGAVKAAGLAKRAALRAVEGWAAARYDVLLAISEGDRRLLAEETGRTPLVVPLVPVTAVAAGGSAEAEVGGGGTGADVLFVGAMARDHNQAGVRWFLDHVWERIAVAVPKARFVVVGGNPPGWLLARADGERVVVTGFVDAVAPWYRSAAVFVSPLLVAGGLLQKVMDAMALGVPVVATKVCNHGIGATPGEHLLTVDAPAAFAEAVIGLLRDPAARVRLGKAAQAYIARTYDFEAAMDAWSAAIEARVVVGRPA